MKTIFNPLLALLLLITISGCDKKEAALPDFKPKCKLLSSTLTTNTILWEPFVLQLNYTYDEQDKLIKIATPYPREITELTYDAQNRLVEQLNIFTTPQGEVRKDKWVTGYNNLNKVDKQENKINYYGSDFTSLRFYTHKYNSAKERIETKHYIPDRQTAFYTYKYTYTNGQISQIIEYDLNGNESAKVKVSHDGKFSPIPDLPLLFYEATRGPVNPATPLFRQNVTSYISTSPDGIDIYEHESYTATYSYNKHGYPTEAIITYLNGEKETIVYTYDCGE